MYSENNMWIKCLESQKQRDYDKQHISIALTLLQRVLLKRFVFSCGGVRLPMCTYTRGWRAYTEMLLPSISPLHTDPCIQAQYCRFSVFHMGGPVYSFLIRAVFQYKRNHLTNIVSDCDSFFTSSDIVSCCSQHSSRWILCPDLKACFNV